MAIGIPVFTETSPARLEHGAGLPDFPRLGFYPEQAEAQLKGASHVLLAGVRAHAALFGGYVTFGKSLFPRGTAYTAAARGPGLCARVCSSRYGPR